MKMEPREDKTRKDLTKGAKLETVGLSLAACTSAAAFDELCYRPFGTSLPSLEQVEIDQSAHALHLYTFSCIRNRFPLHPGRKTPVLGARVSIEILWYVCSGVPWVVVGKWL